MGKLIRLHHSEIRVFRTDLGWMALETRARTICNLVFGHDTAKAAEVQIVRAVEANSDGYTNETSTENAWIEELVERLRDYAAGRPVEFDDFEVDTSAMTDFGRRVIKACRKIPYGHTLTYAVLAAKAGSRGAARAVGNRMAKNRVPLIVPCHRVLAAGNRLGGYSAPGGVKLKLRLLEMEAGNI
ncbi:MAG: methylated-DNA--[protein]-cysteine S-methyltransferase [Pirellulales bacterium]|nr:methylated-DNA--[protein]-cysteine S-methyltransferase [Pirellulales bacterium]